MKVLVCGGRDFRGMDLLCEVLDAIHQEEGPIATIIEGGANGADNLAQLWAKGRGLEVETFNAKWDKHGKYAGPIRNQEMLDKGVPDLVVAFPGGKGTKDMVTRAQKQGFTVREIKE